ncbi:hypothetical protein N0V82_010095 [Gnomoniopsis sp. IMI 355080]|nr:hypothetical protein N0V82_010095 [Gnomoniopsis sp. IMI 355080]
MPEGLPIDHKAKLDGLITSYAEQVLICTGKDDWPSRIEDDNSGDNLAADLKELFGRGGVYSDPFHNISVLNSSFPSSVPKRAEIQNTSAYLLPSFKYIPFLPRVSFDSVEALAKGYLLPEQLHAMHDGLSPIHRDRLTRKPMYQGLLHGVRDVDDILVLICGHGGRDMRCGVMGSVLRDEFEAQFSREGLDVLQRPVRIDSDESLAIVAGTVQKPALTARLGLISHIGGHKFAGNVIIYLPRLMEKADGERHPLAGHGIWYGRVEPKHVQGIVQETIQRGNSSPSQTTGASPAKPSRRRRLYLLALVALALATLSQRSKSDPRATLNKDLFTPCTVVSNLPLSFNSFLLTIQLPPLATNDAAIAAAWRHGLWSIEVKQPQLQIARHYTPLPSQAAAAAAAAGQLQLYVRQYEGGEVSTYLSRLRAGEQIEIRGPHLGFDLGARLGPQEGVSRKVVFLAGGTGVTPALQAAEYALRRDDRVDVEILWANRSGVDCAGCQRLPGERSGWFSSGKGPVDGRHLKEEPSALVRQIKELQAAYERKGRKLEVKCAVDEEGSVVKARDIMDAVGKLGHFEGPFSPSCHFHSQRQLEYSTEESDVFSSSPNGDEKGNPAPHCICEGEGVKGKNLLIVSGPDGFVSAYVGPKVWADGGERQGPVGGVISALMKRNPEIWKGWLVLKQ